MNWEQVGGLFNYWIVIFLMMTGFYIVLARKNLIKSVIGLNIFQTSVFLLYITMGKINGGTAPIIPPAIAAAASHGHHGDDAASHADDASHALEHAVGHSTEHAVGHSTEHAVGHSIEHAAGHVAEQAGEAILYSNPLPSVLMLTAIVVGVATTSLALALVVRIREDYGSIDEEQILKLDRGE